MILSDNINFFQINSLIFFVELHLVLLLALIRNYDAPLNFLNPLLMVGFLIMLILFLYSLK